MNIFANFISLLNVIINLIKVIVSWPTAVVLIVFMLRKDISKMVDKLNFQDLGVKNLFRIDKPELKSEKKPKEK